MALARSLLIRVDHDEQLPKGCWTLLVLVVVVSKTASSTYVNRCETPVDSSFATRAPNESFKRSSHSVRMEAVGAIEGVTEGAAVGFGTGCLVGFPGVGVGAEVGFVVGDVVGRAVGDVVGAVVGCAVGFAEGLGVGEGVGIAVGTVLG